MADEIEDVKPAAGDNQEAESGAKPQADGDSGEAADAKPE